MCTTVCVLCYVFICGLRNWSFVTLPLLCIHEFKLLIITFSFGYVISLVH